MRATAIALGLAFLALPACSGVQEAVLGTRPEEPIDEEESYLNGGGPTSKVDLGEGEESLLTRFQAVLDEKLRLEDREEELLAEIDALRTALAREQKERSNAERLRAGADAEADRLRATKTERELKILHLQMQIAQLQRGQVEEQIASIERQIQRQAPQAAKPATPGAEGR